MTVEHVEPDPVATLGVTVLHVFDHSVPEISGYSVRSLHILRAQRRCGIKTIQLTGPQHRQSEHLSERVDGVEFFRTKDSAPSWIRSRLFRAAWAVLALRRRISGLLTTHRPDLIHAHSPVTCGLASLWLGVPVVYEMRTLWEDGAIVDGRMKQGGLSHRIVRAIETFLVKRVDRVVAISEGLRQEVLSRGVAPDRVSVVVNGVEIRDSAALSEGHEHIRQKLGLIGSPVLGYVGSLFGWEGLDLLVRAMPELKRQFKDITLLLVGDGPVHDDLAKLVDELDVTRAVHFAGRLPMAEAAAAYGVIDVLVYPRTRTKLTDLVTPLKPLEAMALGRPLVASDVGGHRELIRDGETGCLFAAGSVESLVKAITRLLGDDDLRERLTRCARDYVSQERTWEVVTSNYGNIYQLELNRIGSEAVSH